MIARVYLSTKVGRDHFFLNLRDGTNIGQLCELLGANALAKLGGNDTVREAVTTGPLDTKADYCVYPDNIGVTVERLRRYVGRVLKDP